jgi:hypothetical protein
VAGEHREHRPGDPAPLDLDVGGGVAAEEPERLVERGDGGSVREAQRGHLACGERRDRARLGRAVGAERAGHGIVVDHDGAVTGRVHVQLHRVRAQHERPREPREGIFDALARRAAVADDLGTGSGHAGGGRRGMAGSRQRGVNVPGRPASNGRATMTRQSYDDGAEEDGALVRRWLAGDERAATALVTRHADAVARFAASAGARDDVEEVVQDTFVRAFGSLEGFRGDSSLRTWLFTIARRLLLDRGRATGRSRERVAVATTSRRGRTRRSTRSWPTRPRRASAARSIGSRRCSGTCSPFA